MKYLFYIAFFFVLVFTSCEDHNMTTPKPKGYPKITFPEKGYQQFDKNYCQFKFEYPQYAQVNKDTLFFNEKPEDECWFDIEIKQFNAKLHCTYYPVGKVKSFDQLRADAFQMAQKHNVKAAFIEEKPLKKPDGTTGFLFSIEGEVATPLQFYLTDEKKHFIRGALYFRSKVQPDSLAPIFNFLKQDVSHLIETFEWN